MSNDRIWGTINSFVSGMMLVLALNSIKQNDAFWTAMFLVVMFFNLICAWAELKK